MSDEIKAALYITAWNIVFFASVEIGRAKGAGLGWLIFGFLAVILIMILLHDIRSTEKDEHLKATRNLFDRLYQETYGQYDIGEVRTNGDKHRG
ncbi:MAG: hypothetical protein IJ737_08100 [Ruminococcus sp.]|nr:hypothetical protein [Ruminococcus sp.]